MKKLNPILEAILEIRRVKRFLLSEQVGGFSKISREALETLLRRLERNFAEELSKKASREIFEALLEREAYESVSKGRVGREVFEDLVNKFPQLEKFPEFQEFVIQKIDPEKMAEELAKKPLDDILMKKGLLTSEESGTVGKIEPPKPKPNEPEVEGNVVRKPKPESDDLDKGPDLKLGPRPDEPDVPQDIPDTLKFPKPDGDVPEKPVDLPPVPDKTPPKTDGESIPEGEPTPEGEPVPEKKPVPRKIPLPLPNPNPEPSPEPIAPPLPIPIPIPVPRTSEPDENTRRTARSLGDLLKRKANVPDLEQMYANVQGELANLDIGLAPERILGRYSGSYRIR